MKTSIYFRELIHFSNQVVMKMRDDYGINMDREMQLWYAERVGFYYFRGDDVATAAFKLVNENAVRPPSAD